MNTLLIIIGAAIGAPARYAIDQYLRRFTTKPYGTFAVNILGSFLIGLTFKSTESWRDLLAIGFAGAFTTWSTFMLDLYLAYELLTKVKEMLKFKIIVFLFKSRLIFVLDKQLSYIT